MLVLLLTMRTWYKERVGAAGAGRNRRRLGRRRAAVRQEEGRGAESSHRCPVPGAGGAGWELGGEAVDGVIAPSTDHRPREEKLMARSSIMEWVRA